jgi:signal transduction histidine kinase
VLGAAWLGGGRAGVATIAATLVVIAAWRTPAASLTASSATAGAAVFVVCGIGFSYVAHLMRRAHDQEQRLRRGYLVFATALSNATTPEEVARALVDEGAQALEADVSAFAHLVDPDTLEVIAHRGVEPPLPPRSRFPAATQGPLGLVLRTGNEYLIETADEFRATFTDSVFRPDPANCSTAALPLKVGDRIVGAIALRFKTERRFSHEERDLLRTLAAQSAQAFERASLLVKERTAAQRTRALIDLAAVLASSQSVADVGDAVVREGRRASQADTSMLYVVDGARLRLVAESGCAPEVVEQLREIAHDSDHGRRLAREHWLEGRDDYPTAMPEVAAISSSHRRVASAWSIPLVIEAQPVGMLAMGFYEARQFPEEEREFARLFAQHCAQAAARAERSGAAQAADRAKDQFLAMLGHELRNPLASITAAMDLIQLRGLPGADRELGIMSRQLAQLTHMVDDLLDVSRIQAGKIELARSRAELSELLGRAVETVAPQLEARRHRLTIDAPPVGLMVDVDEARIVQVLANVLSNAAKYTDPSGEIGVGARRDVCDAVIEVHDTGVGIDAALLPHVLDPFIQEAQSVARSRGGLGLGLAIARTFVQLHGGEIAVHSDGKGAGTRVVIRLPLAGPAAPGVPDAVVAEPATRAEPAGHGVPRAAGADGSARNRA